MTRIEEEARAAANGGGAHAASQPRNVQPKARTFGQFLHRLFTVMGEFTADGAPVAERIIADPQFDQALELLLRGHQAGVIADMVAVMSDTLRHRLDQPQGTGPQPFLPAPAAVDGI